MGAHRNQEWHHRGGDLSWGSPRVNRKVRRVSLGKQGCGGAGLTLVEDGMADLFKGGYHYRCRDHSDGGVRGRDQAQL